MAKISIEQLVDDLLDFTGDKSLGKPANGNDLKEGIITAPILFGAEENEEIRSLFLRRFLHPQDTERVSKYPVFSYVLLTPYEGPHSTSLNIGFWED